MPKTFSDLTPVQQEFFERVEAGLRRMAKDEAILNVYGDGSASPAGEKFAATRLGHSWEVVFDFNEGWCFHTAIQLPVNI